jgi:RNA polymerase sigma factor (sigma-70 family)
MASGGASVDWAAVWDEHGEAMLAVARTQLRGRVADGHTDEDIVGEVLVSQIRNPAGYDAAEDKRAYLAAAVRNRCWSKLKRGLRQVVRDADAVRALTDHRPSEDPVGDQATDDALASAIAACLDRLTDKQQIAIRRRVMNEEASVDIAADLARSPAIVSQHVNAGLARLREDPTFLALATWNDDVERQT